MKLRKPRQSQADNNNNNNDEVNQPNQALYGSVAPQKERVFMDFNKEPKSFIIPSSFTLNHYERFQQAMSTHPNYKTAKDVDLRRWRAKASKDTHLVKCLSLPFSRSEATDQTLASFARKVPPTLGRLERFDADFASTKITDYGIQELLMKSRGLLGNVKAFSMNLTRTQASERTLDMLIKHALPYFGILESFELDISFMNIDNQALRRFWIGLRPFARKLKRFSFTMEGQGVSDAIVRDLAEIIFPRMTLLESLKLTLNPFAKAITDVSVENIFQSCHLNSIKALKLEFQACWTRSLKISDAGFGILARNLGTFMPGLESLELILDLNSFTDDSLYEFWPNLALIAKNLKTFKFSLNGIKITNRCFSVFCQDILPSMSSLKTFEINLRTELSEYAYKILFSGLKRIADHIEDLNLLLAGCEHVTDKNFQLFTKPCLPLMKNIRKLRVNLAYSKVSWKSLEAIISKVGEFKNLEFLEVKHEVEMNKWSNADQLETRYPGVRFADEKRIIYHQI